jgi:hypothetical protein
VAGRDAGHGAGGRRPSVRAKPPVAVPEPGRRERRRDQRDQRRLSVSGDGNTYEEVNVSQCTAVVNQANTGNQQTQQALQQYGYYYDAYQYANQDATQTKVQDADA